MESEVLEEKTKPFRLVKYFTFSSLIVIFAGAVALSLINTHWAKRMLLKKNEAYAHSLIENLNHQVFLQFMIPIQLKYGKIQLSDEVQNQWMDRVVRNTLHSFMVESVNIYDMEHVLSYSYDKLLIGQKNVGGTGYEKALKGESTSKLMQRGNFLAIVLGFPKESQIITFAPLRSERPPSRISGDVVGVVEIVQDLSEDYKVIFRVQMLFVITCTVIMGLLFLVLRFLVKRGEDIIEKRALERMQLREQLNQAERLSTLGEMMAGISHEIRNPLGIIKNSAELLQKKMLNGTDKNSIPEIIIEESGRLNSIITDFLNYARPRVPNLASCRVDGIFEKNISFLASQIDEQGYTIQRRYNEHIPEIMADDDMLYQAFLNILFNAMQAMPAGGIITVGIQANDQTVTLVVEDEGEGISEEDIERIWDPFFTTKDRGTGLGLGIVKNIIESHGGSIRIENRDMTGARVTIGIPIKRGE